jgi:hypothetical protein
VSESKVKPCDIPCSKCGSEKVARVFYVNGAEMYSDAYGKAPSPHSTGPGTRHWTATKDHLMNYCQSCRYQWATMPLATTKARSKSKGR